MVANQGQRKKTRQYIKQGRGSIFSKYQQLGSTTLFKLVNFFLTINLGSRYYSPHFIAK